MLLEVSRLARPASPAPNVRRESLLEKETGEILSLQPRHSLSSRVTGRRVNVPPRGIWNEGAVCATDCSAVDAIHPMTPGANGKGRKKDNRWHRLQLVDLEVHRARSNVVNGYRVRR